MTPPPPPSSEPKMFRSRFRLNVGLDGVTGDTTVHTLVDHSWMVGLLMFAQYIHVFVYIYIYLGKLQSFPNLN